jgi:cytosine/adenosine deaminase-related metal-dependent hydrolase
MVMKGCTAAYDLAAEFPLPSVDGLSAMAKAYEEVGMRAVLAPMVADLSFFEASRPDGTPPPALKKGRELRRRLEGDHGK